MVWTYENSYANFTSVIDVDYTEEEITMRILRSLTTKVLAVALCALCAFSMLVIAPEVKAASETPITETKKTETKGTESRKGRARGKTRCRKT